MADKYTKYFAMLPSDVMAIDHTVLNATAKLVYSIIFTMLNTRDKFYMSNKIIGERLGNYKPTNISRCVSKLEELGLINIEMIKNENGGYAGRLVSLRKYPIENNTRGYGTKVQGGLVQKYKGALYDSTNKYISENRLVNKLDKDTLSSSKTEHDHTAAKEVIDYLNEVSGKHFKHAETNYRVIEPRLNEYSMDDLKKVIRNKFNQWYKTPYFKYIQPKTLFRASNFEGYVNELPNEEKKGADTYGVDF